MRIAILGGGFTGLSAAYYLRKKGHDVTLFEKETVLGGLAAGFRAVNWEWHLERSYHHLFSNDIYILNFSKEIGFSNIVFRSPETASLYEFCETGKPATGNFRAFPVDTPQDFLKFPLLSLPLKLRAALVLAFLKFSPFLTLYEKMTAKEFLTKTMGEEAWNVLWQELFRKKFGKYAENILASFLWARITKRTKDLGYPSGGFQALINHTEKRLVEMGVEVKKGTEVVEIEIRNSKFEILNFSYDVVVATLPTPVITKITAPLFPQEYLKRLQKIQFLHAVNLIVETKEPLLEKTYWLSICTPKLPMMVVVQHTNLIDKKHYGGNNILYVGNYIDQDNPLLRMSSEEILKHYEPHLKQINPKYEILNTKYYPFKAPFAQPIFDKEFLTVKPDFETPVKNFFIANLDMTYPYDRGTNYAVKLGREVSSFF